MRTQFAISSVFVYTMFLHAFNSAALQKTSSPKNSQNILTWSQLKLINIDFCNEADNFSHFMLFYHQGVVLANL